MQAKRTPKLGPETSNIDSVNNKLTVLIPVRDDWRALSELLEALDRELGAVHPDVSVLVVDDGSQRTVSECGVKFGPFANFQKVSVLELKRNLGHQRAIALGLT